MGPVAQRLLPIARLIGQHLAHQIPAHQSLARPRLGHQTRIIEILRRQHPLHRSAGPQPADQRSRVDRFDGHDPGGPQIFAQTLLRAKVALHPAVFPHDKPRQLGPPTFHVLGIHAVVADLRIGHRHNLPAITRIGENLLISRHRGIKTNFAVHLPGCADRNARVDSTILQCEFCGGRHGNQRSATKASSPSKAH